MTAKFNVGDDVIPTGGARGDVLEVREVRDGVTVYGIEDTNGGVNYYTERALRTAPPR